jgi:type I restriction enzyme S subunit
MEGWQMKHKPYPAYKPSGVEWLGDVPEHWEVKKARRCLIEHKQGYYTTEAYVDEGFKLLRITDLDGDGSFKIDDCPSVDAKDDAKPFLLKDGDFVFARTGGAGTFGLIKNINVNIVFASYLIRFRFKKEVDGNFLRYQFLSVNFAHSIIKNIHGGVNHNVHAEDIKDQFLYLPPITEQQSIGAFLDSETGRIGTLVAKKERLIELLREKRLALIFHAVTKGIDPSVKLKPSGVEWLGDVPEHWEIVPFKKYVAELTDYRGATPEKVDEGTFLVTAKNIKMGYIDYECSQEFVLQSDYFKIMRRGLPKIGDILFTTEAPLGNVALVDKEDVALAQRVIRFRMNEEFTAQFSVNFMMSLFFQSLLGCLSTGSTAEGIKASKITKLIFLKPLIREQQAIAAFLDRETGKIDALIAKVGVAITRLKEYRTALISAAVTGKIDVREAA